MERGRRGPLYMRYHFTHFPSKLNLTPLTLITTNVSYLRQMNYYNEYDRKTAAWLRELIKAGAIPDGHVDERSIADVQPSDLAGYTQCHFFAGIGGWSYALQLTGWPADRPVWTGSCPCQPFSTAGKGLGTADERHLWPVFFELIRKCHPQYVFGEQVASAIGHGWLDGVSADLEAEGYTCGAAVLGAHSVNAPHQRQRLYWVADAASNGLNQRQYAGDVVCQTEEKCKHEPVELSHCPIRNGSDGGLADAGYLRWRDRPFSSQSPHHEASRRYENGWMDNSKCAGSQGLRFSGSIDSSDGIRERFGEFAETSSWSDFHLVHCRDGKTRRVPTEPAFQPLAHGIPARVVRLRGYGNAIVPQIAAVFIAAFMDIEAD
jgi:DNA (cytosine-5)-methyltransferase 1